jgi:hypothetical protein
MTRYFDKNGCPRWKEPMTEEEGHEMEAFALSGVWPASFACLPEDADTSNITPFPRKPKAAR